MSTYTIVSKLTQVGRNFPSCLPGTSFLLCIVNLLWVQTPLFSQTKTLTRAYPGTQFWLELQVSLGQSSHPPGGVHESTVIGPSGQRASHLVSWPPYSAANMVPVAKGKWNGFIILGDLVPVINSKDARLRALLM